MGVVVLHADRLELLVERPFRREILGVEVVGDRLRLDPEHREVELDVGEKGAVGELGVEIAEVGREERVGPPGEAEGALELGADGEDWRRGGDRQPGRRPRRVAARAPQREGRAHDRVLAAAVDRAVVAEEGVGDRAEPLACLGVVEGDRLVAHVAAGHHERPREPGAQQVVERGVGEHHPEPRGRGRDPARERRPLAPAQQHDRPARRAWRSSRLALAELGEQLRLSRHERERLFIALLARARSRSTAGSLAASQARCQPPRPLIARIAPPARRRPPRSSGSEEARPADRAAHGLGVEAPVGRILVLAPAHRRRRAGRQPWRCSRGRRERRGRS